MIVDDRNQSEADEDLLAPTVSRYARLCCMGSKRSRGSPAYLARRPSPQTPHELSGHDCIGLRLPTYGGLLTWEFKHGERVTTAHVKGRLVFNRSDLMADAAVAGNGLAWLSDDMVREHLEAGRLATVLDDWEISFPDDHLYYASRRSSTALALAHVIDALRLPKSR